MMGAASHASVHTKQGGNDVGAEKTRGEGHGAISGSISPCSQHVEVSLGKICNP